MDILNNQMTLNIKEPDINAFLRMMDAATALRKQGEEVDRQLSFDEIKADLRERILNTCKETGESLSGSQIDAAINSYMSGLYSFKEPKKSFSTALANFYIDRVRIGKRYGIPFLGLLAITAATWTGGKAISTVNRHVGEGRVETAVVENYEDKRELENGLLSLSKSPIKKQLPLVEKNELESIVDYSATHLKLTEGFFKRFCSRGTAKDDVTGQNYKEASMQLAGVEKELAGIRGKLNSGEEILSLQQNLTSTKRALDSLIVEVRQSNPPTVFLGKAEQAYVSGIAALNVRDIIDGQKYSQQLSSVKTDAKQFAILPGQAEQLYSSILSEAREKAARARGEELHALAQDSVKNVDVSSLRNAVKEMQTIDSVLKKEYTIQIASREGVKSGIDRYYNGRFSGWYLIVEAKDRSGRIVPVNITSCEDGRTKTVDMWGERVKGNNPEIVEEIEDGYSDNTLLVRVIEDKLDDGVVDNNLMGVKRRGYLNYKLNYADFEGKQITQW